MKRTFGWIVGTATFFLGGMVYAQGPGPYYPSPGMPAPYYPPPGMPAPNLSPYGYQGYPTNPYRPPLPSASAPPGMVPPPFAPSNMPFGNANPGGMPQPYSPEGMPRKTNPDAVPPPFAPSGMPNGNSSPNGIPQPVPPNGMPQGGYQGTAPLGSGGMFYGVPNAGMAPMPPSLNPGGQAFPPPPMPVPGNQKFPPPPAPNPGSPTFPPAPMPVPGSQTFPPPPTPVPGTQTVPAPTPMPPEPNPGLQTFPPAPAPLTPLPPSELKPAPNLPALPPVESPGQPEKLPPFASPPSLAAPPAPPAQPEFGPQGLVAPMVYMPALAVYEPPAEPYVVYEGVRSLAELKEDATHVWIQANYLHWWVRRDMTPPLVTTGNSTSTSPGALGNADTVVLLGGSISPNEFTGIQASAGVWLDNEHTFGLEIGGFWLGTHSQTYSFASDATGNPLIAQPIVIAGLEQALAFTFPGLLSGRLDATSTLALHGADLNYVNNLYRIAGWSVDVLGGFRYMYLNDALGINESFTTLANGVILTNGVAQPAGTNFLLTDSFNVANRFYGGQIGARVSWTWCGFDISAVGKLGVGATIHTVTIDGFTTIVGTDGTRNTFPGGLYAQPSNIGRYQVTDTSFIPELTATLGYQVTPCIRLLAGYTVLGWTNVMRAGNQIDRNIDTIQAPSTNAFVAGATGAAPNFPASRTGFWAQGLNLGVEFRY